MIEIRIRFLAGRYSATPWAHHVNEGEPEWPPSPWRLLRALVASWKRFHPEWPEHRVAAVLEELRVAPEFWLPQASVGHSRHFMPLRRGPDDRTLVFDTFVRLDPREPLAVRWPTGSLRDEVRSDLEELLRGITYFGRSESWSELRLARPEEELSGAGAPCRPVQLSEQPPPQSRVVELLGPDPAVEVSQLLEALLMDTAELRTRRKRLEPPASHWLRYALPEGALRSAPPAASGRRRAARHPDDPVLALRYVFDRAPLPPLERALAIGDQARRAAMGLYGRMNGGQSSPTLSGRLGARPAQGHRHAFYLPLDEDRDQRIDHLLIYAPAGFSEEELVALAQLRELPWGERGAHEGPRLLLLDLLRRSQWKRLDRRADPNVPRALGPARRWISVTPYVMTRFPKLDHRGRPKQNPDGSQRDGPEEQVRREWEQRRAVDPSLPVLAKVEVLPAGHRRWLRFQLVRPGGGRSTGMAVGLRLEFAAPLTGPLALGYACHYGLGLFEGDEEAEGQRRAGSNP